MKDLLVKKEVVIDIYDLICWIERNIGKPLSVNDVVLKSGYSSFYLQRSFKQVTGEPVARYIRRRKLNISCTLLYETDFSILDISVALGFDDVSTFYRSFRREFGISPADFRRNCLKIDSL